MISLPKLLGFVYWRHDRGEVVPPISSHCTYSLVPILPVSTPSLRYVATLRKTMSPISSPESTSHHIRNPRRSVLLTGENM